MLTCYHDETEWIVAESPEDASAIQAEYIGEEASSPDQFSEVDPSTSMTIECDVSEVFNGDIRQTKTVSEWIEWNGRGMLCSTEW